MGHRGYRPPPVSAPELILNRKKIVVLPRSGVNPREGSCNRRKSSDLSRTAGGQKDTQRADVFGMFVFVVYFIGLTAGCSPDPQMMLISRVRANNSRKPNRKSAWCTDFTYGSHGE